MCDSDSITTSATAKSYGPSGPERRDDMATLLERRIDAIFQLLCPPGGGVDTEAITLALAYETGIDPTNRLCWEILMAAVVYESEHLAVDDWVARKMKKQGYNTRRFAAFTRQTQPAAL